jgi:AspT/YidE/YbjL antiporter-like protein
MLDLARDIIGSQPILTLFLAIGLGYLVGQISIAGFSLGVGAVLFVGLALGAFAPKAQIIGPIGLTGLIMFLYGIGILYGRQFFEGMVGVGQKYNLLALVACMASLLVALGLGHLFGIKIGHTLGLYAGSMTSTATLQAALDVMKNKDPSIGYSIAYPFGVIGPILCIYFMTQIVKPKFPAKAQRFHMAEISLGPTFAGKKLEDLASTALTGVRVTMVRKRAATTSFRHPIRFYPREMPFSSSRNVRTRLPRRQRSSGAWSRADWQAIALISTTSGSLSERRAWSAYPLPSCRCRSVIRHICCTCVDTTPTWCHRRTSCWNSATGSVC